MKHPRAKQIISLCESANAGVISLESTGWPATQHFNHVKLTTSMLTSLANQVVDDYAAMAKRLSDIEQRLAKIDGIEVDDLISKQQDIV